MTTYLDVKESRLVSRALKCLESHMRYDGEILSNSELVCAYLRMQLASELNEVFSVLFLDSQNRKIAFDKLFFGTVNEASVYPRRVIQRSLEHNAAKVIFAHNHPSGNSNPSDADYSITQDLKTILKVIDVAVLDHIIVSSKNTFSFAEHGLI